MVHIPGRDGKCLGCIAKLATAAPVFMPWFWDMRARFPDLHVSWGYRNKAEQELAVIEKTSKLHWPLSAHNRRVLIDPTKPGDVTLETDPNTRPESGAVDLFEIFDGKPFWHPNIMTQIAGISPQFLWGGTFKDLGDYDHFQIKEP